MELRLAGVKLYYVAMELRFVWTAGMEPRLAGMEHRLAEIKLILAGMMLRLAWSL